MSLAAFHKVDQLTRLEQQISTDLLCNPSLGLGSRAIYYLIHVHVSLTRQGLAGPTSEYAEYMTQILTWYIKSHCAVDFFEAALGVCLRGWRSTSGLRRTASSYLQKLG
jgi:hypothetical protein